MTYLVQGADGATYGPVDVPMLQAWAQAGRITPDTWLAASAEAPPFRAGDLPDLRAFWPVPSGASSLPCPHCGQPVTNGAAFCPSCGFGGRPMTAGMGLTLGPPPKMVTGHSSADYALGLLGTLLLLIGPCLCSFFAPGSVGGTPAVFWLLGWSVPTLICWTRLRGHPFLRRGIGTALVVAFVTLPIALTLGLISSVHSFFSAALKPCNTP